MSESGPEYLTVKEVSDLLRVDRSTVERWVRRNVIRSVVIEGVIRIPRSAVTDEPCRTCQHRLEA